ncbi:MAG: DUF2339 domain-containing protein [Rhodanobacteraceae bacterium]|nr:DUF2339 domain-containing protein [Rhodanobacteraceae bacterium]
MAWLLGFFGLIIGLGCAEAGDWTLGAIGGALIGALLGSYLSMRTRMTEFERRLQLLQTRRSAESVPVPARAPVAEPSAMPAHTPTAAPPPLPQRPAALAVEAAVTQASIATSSDVAAEPGDGEPAIEQKPHRAPPALPQRTPVHTVATVSEQSALAKWLFESSWIAKVGIALVFIGVGALLRFAVKEGWLDFPIEMRLVGIAAAALAALAVGWRQREQKRIFALNLQGGAIGVLMMVVFAAYRMYHLIPVTATFAMLIVLVAGTALLAIRQNSLGLAMFGVVGGFAAPILASTGSGNHVALFGFYVVLNLAILAISYARGWRILNAVGFLFTFVIATFWGVLSYQSDKFASTEPFLITFFVFYLAIPLLPTLRGHNPTRRDHVEGSLVFGTPLIGFALQAGDVA